VIGAPEIATDGCRPYQSAIRDVFGNGEIIRIVDCFPFRVFAKKSLPCNFRLWQHNLPEGDIRSAAKQAVIRAPRPRGRAT
jgi:hypothetical protein